MCNNVLSEYSVTEDSICGIKMYIHETVAQFLEDINKILLKLLITFILFCSKHTLIKTVIK